MALASAFQPGSFRPRGGADAFRRAVIFLAAGLVVGLVIGLASGWMAGGNTPKPDTQIAANFPAARYPAAQPLATSPVRSSPSQDWRNMRRMRLAGPYRAQVLHIVDGDTFVARIPVWLGQDIVTRVRLRGIDTPEMNGRCRKEVEKAGEARQVLREFLASGRVSLRDIGTGKYAGRVIARAYVRVPGEGAAQDAGAMLLAGGYARPYSGGRRRGWCGPGKYSR